MSAYEAVRGYLRRIPSDTERGMPSCSPKGRMPQRCRHPCLLYPSRDSSGARIGTRLQFAQLTTLFSLDTMRQRSLLATVVRFDVTAPSINEPNPLNNLGDFVQDNAQQIEKVVYWISDSH